MKIKILFIICLFYCANLFAQYEKISPLLENKLLQNNTLKNKRIQAITLPFFDDFYQNNIQPKNNLWQDNNVLINNNFAENPITIGIATFDGLNNVGKPYSLLATATGIADVLTSQIIDLNGLTNLDNVYLSFYYKGEGLGENPQFNKDFFMVDFLDNTGNWTEKWKTTYFDTITDFKQIFIKADSNFLHSNFQFRFKAFGTLAGNADHWHLDYVKLDKNRNIAIEENVPEMAYQNIPNSLLKRYYTMPYNQYDTTDLKDTIAVSVRNNFTNATTDIVDFYTATNQNNSTIIANYNGSSRDFFPNTNNIIKYPKFIIPLGITGDTVQIKVDYNFDCSAESGSSTDVLANNKITKYQTFSNYFAYDDATAERVYRVSDVNNGAIALKYNLKITDTLRAVKINFSPLQSNYAMATFSIIVWKQIAFAGNTENIIYQHDNLKLADLVKEFGIDTINGFLYYNFKSNYVQNGQTFPMILSDSFYVGLKIDTKNTITFGFDVNNDGSQNTYYFNGVNWNQSVKKGAVMINPVFGKMQPLFLLSNKPKINTYNFDIYPNPAKNTIFINGINENSTIDILTIDGKIIRNTQSNQPLNLDISTLENAIYFIRIKGNKTNKIGISKFIKIE